MTDLTKLFDKKLTATILNVDLNRKVGGKKFTYDKAKISGDETFEVGDANIGINGEAGLLLQTHPVGKELQIEKTTYLPGNDQAFVEAKFTARGKANISGTGNASGVDLSLKADMEKGVSFRHLKPFGKNSKLLDALKQITHEARVPVLMDLDSVRDQHIYAMSSNFNLDFGLTASYGYEKTFAANLFGNINAPVKAQLEASLKASLGYCLKNDFEVVVDRLSTLNDGWVRVYVDTARSSRLSLGAQFNLQVNYDLGSGLIGLLDEALGSQPFVRLNKALEKFDDEDFKNIAAGEWTTILKKLEDKTVAALQTYLKVDDLAKVIAESEEAKKIDAALVKLKQFINEYDQLDDKIQSLFDRVLGYVDLEEGSPFRKYLENLAEYKNGLPAGTFTQFLNDQTQEWIEVFETLAGRSVEEIILSRDEDAQRLLKNVAAIAAQTLKFLTDASDLITVPIKEFAEKTGIEATVNWLRENATSVPDLVGRLKDKANALIADLVSNVLGKIYSKIDQDDLKQISDFAQKISELIKTYRDAPEKIKQELAKLKGEVGYSLAFEWERLKSQTKVLDVELNPRNRDCRKAFKKLRTFGIRDFIEALPYPEDDDEDLSFMLRECVLTSSRKTTGALNIFSSVFGGAKSKTIREEKARLEVTQTDKTFSTFGEYEGSYTRIFGDSTIGDSWQAGVHLELSGKRENERKIDLDKGWKEIAQSLRLTISRHDPQCRDLEALGMINLLTTLGFDTYGLKPENYENRKTELMIKLQLKDNNAVQEILENDDQEQWEKNYVSAAQHWYTTPIPKVVTKGSDVPKDGWPAGKFLGNYVASQEYRELLKDDRWGRNASAQELLGRELRIDGKLFGEFKLFSALAYIPKDAENADNNWKKVTRVRIDKSPEKCLELVRKFAKAIQKTSLNKQRSFQSPMFAIFMTLMRLRAKGVDLNLFKGVAVLRTWNDQGVAETKTLVMQDLALYLIGY